MGNSYDYWQQRDTNRRLKGVQATGSEQTEILRALLWEIQQTNLMLAQVVAGLPTPIARRRT